PRLTPDAAHTAAMPMPPRGDGATPASGVAATTHATVDARRPTPATTGESMVLLEPAAEPVRARGLANPRTRLAVLALAALTVAGTAFLWLAPHGIAPDAQRSTRPVATRPHAAAAGHPAGPPDSTRGTTPVVVPPTSPAAAAAPPRLTVTNPADSAAAAVYAVYVVASNTPDGASVDWRVDRTPPVLALTPVLQDGEPSYRLIVGAYRTRAQADSLLRDLQHRGVLGDESGRVVRAPYALLVEPRVPAAGAAARVQALAARGVPTYPLSRGDGTVALYAGAFETADEAAYLARTARAAGVSTTLVYRTGSAL
ncbi:MAG TPA: hypothetical protein VGD56_08945, partial [Gemmatirosa sp.]